MLLTKHEVEFYDLLFPDGTLYKFNLNTTRFYWGVIGEGMPKATLRTQRSPFQDGVTVLGHRLEPRMLTMTLSRDSKDNFDYYSVRSDIINKFRLNRQTAEGVFEPSVLRKRLPNGDIRSINVFLDMGFLFQGDGINDFNGYRVTEVIRFFCPNPIYYDPTMIQTNILFSAAEDLVFPVQGPISFSGNIYTTDTITYTGTHKSFPILNWTGPARNPILQNRITNKKVKLDYTIPVYETITITLGQEVYSIVDSNGSDLKGIITADSDTDWALVPDPLAPDGDNDLFMSATETDANTEFIMQYFLRYQGF